MKIQAIQSTKEPNKLKLHSPSVKGINIHIIDGGAHADNMEHYAKAIMRTVNKDLRINMHYIDINKKDPNSKQMSSLEDMLKTISSTLHSGDYLAIPGLASVPILNLQDRIRDVLKKYITLTPQNIKLHKETLLNMLNELYTYPNYYRTQVGYIDRNQQDLSYVWGVIQEINKLVRKGVNVYIPAGHGADSAIKWKAKDKGLGDELYRYIAKGEDTRYGDVKQIFNEAKTDNWYDFNLLSLSNAKIVNVKNTNDKDYIFSAYDTCVNDGARGVYNFYPIRNGYGKLIGYSYHDRTSVEFPYGEFIANGQIANLCDYVGLNVNDIYANNNDINLFKKLVRKGKNTSSLPKKLYPIREIFDENIIRWKKLDILGKLIDRDQKLIFDLNSKKEILYQKTNCEGSDRPSVLSMWGSCFSAINAIKRDILRKSDIKTRTYSSSDYIRLGDTDRLNRKYESAEYYYNMALDKLYPNRNKLTSDGSIINLYEKLYDTLKSAGKKNEAKAIGNTLINLKSYAIKDKWTWLPSYLKEMTKLGTLYDDMAEFCKAEGESYPAKVCDWAAYELKCFTKYGNKIVQRRAQQNPYIGDLYDECH